jgi:hypothetical protein
MTTPATEVDLARVTEVFLEALRAGLAQRGAEGAAPALDPEQLAQATAVAEETIQNLVGAKKFDEEIAEKVGTAYSEILQTNPEAASLTREDLDEIFAELAEQVSS